MSPHDVALQLNLASQLDELAEQGCHVHYYATMSHQRKGAEDGRRVELEEITEVARYWSFSFAVIVEEDELKIRAEGGSYGGS